MADVTSSATPYTSPRAYANEEYRPKLLSRLYVRSPFLGMMFKRGGGDGELRPNGLTLVGGGNLSRARRSELRNPGYQVNFFFQLGKGATDQTKNMTVRDTVPQQTSPTTNSQDQQKKSAFVRWSKKMTEVIVWNTSQELGMGSNSIGDAKVDATNIGMQHHLDHLIKEMWVGEPASQTADLWSEQQGIDVAVDDDNTYCGIDRSVAANAGFKSFRIASGNAAALDLIDAYHLDLQGSYTESILDIHKPFDTVLLNRADYHTVKSEALTKNQVTPMSSREMAEIGITTEAVKYGTAVITYDPWLKNYNTLGSSGEPNFSAAGLFTCAADWIVRLHPSHSFSIGKWVEIGDYTEGGKDAMRMLLRTMYQFYSEQAWGSLLDTNIA